MLSVPRSSGRPLQSYFAAPPGPGPHPGVVVIHEIYGLNDNIRDIADRFASAGYAALAVDLFSTGARPVCMARIMNGMLLRPLKNGVVRDLRAALDFLGARSEVDAGRLGAIGFCMGGTYALQLACVGAGVKVASLFYGMNPRPLAAVARACPLVGSYPEKDFTAGAGRKLDTALDGYGVPHDVKVYPGAKHSFFNDRGGAHDPAAATDSWQRTLAFFQEHLSA
ncbi:MAG TPA: dienelactone hydrolase family protein [Candidatus Dormibacteraeota bacterium]|nr:dienelactone hydrolase family protein [Candidatus Dormibacteraeota bacterium]